jgi:hypothetical protein
LLFQFDPEHLPVGPSLRTHLLVALHQLFVLVETLGA